MQTGYANFLGTTENSITFDGLSGPISPTQFSVSHGVTFANLGLGGADNEGGATIQNLDGFDGTFQSDGDTVFSSYPNDVQPVTFTFDTPVSSVGSFVAIGKEGTIDTLTVTAFDATGAILTTLSVPTQLFADGDNRERFWAVTADQPAIAKISILNDSSVDFANAVILDTIAWSTTPALAASMASTSASSGAAAAPVVVEASPKETAAPAIPSFILSVPARSNNGLPRNGLPSRKDPNWRESSPAAHIDALFADFAADPRWTRDLRGDAFSGLTDDFRPQKWQAASDEALAALADDLLQDDDFR